jgi:hypothetical protein
MNTATTTTKIAYETSAPVHPNWRGKTKVFRLSESIKHELTKREATVNAITMVMSEEPREKQDAYRKWVKDLFETQVPEADRGTEREPQTLTVEFNQVVVCCRSDDREDENSPQRSVLLPVLPYISADKVVENADVLSCGAMKHEPGDRTPEEYMAMLGYTVVPAGQVN